MSDSLPKKTGGDHLHLATRVMLSAIPVLGGPTLELFNAVIAPPIERRRNGWLNDLAQRLDTLKQEGRLKIEDLAKNDEFVSAVMQATAVAIRNHHQEKIDALRNAVLNSALGQCPSDVKSAMFLAFVDQFTVWHLRVLKELFDLDSQQGQNRPPKTNIESITEVVVGRISDLRGQQELAEMVVEDLCRKGLLFWSGGQSVTFIPRGASQVSPLGEEFLRYVSEPKGPVGV
ncbi:MAG: hypothetical protein ACLP9L_17520 [Thermoguttaceae bacterium]